MAAPVGGVYIHGLRALDRALGKADKGLRKELRDRLRDIADTVASEARSTASRKGLRASGDLIAGIRPYVITGGAGIRSTAMHRGFDYPRRLEFEGRGGEMFGPRASLLPAVEASRADLLQDAEQLLDLIATDFSGGSS